MLVEKPSEVQDLWWVQYEADGTETLQVRPLQLISVRCLKPSGEEREHSKSTTEHAERDLYHCNMYNTVAVRATATLQMLVYVLFINISYIFLSKYAREFQV